MKLNWQQDTPVQDVCGSKALRDQSKKGNLVVSVHICVIGTNETWDYWPIEG